MERGCFRRKTAPHPALRATFSHGGEKEPAFLFRRRLRRANETLTDKAIPAVRPTDDVDCVAEIVNKIGFYKLEEELEKRGFRRPPVHEGGPICRWKFGEINIDIMPTRENILGFKNSWFASGFKEAFAVSLPHGEVIRIFPLAYLLASKLEAFEDRGRGDFLESADMEDIVTLLDGVMNIKAQLFSASATVKVYIANRFRNFLNKKAFLDCLEGHSSGPGRAEKIHKIAKDISLMA